MKPILTILFVFFTLAQVESNHHDLNTTFTKGREKRWSSWRKKPEVPKPVKQWCEDKLRTTEPTKKIVLKNNRNKDIRDYYLRPYIIRCLLPYEWIYCVKTTSKNPPKNVIVHPFERNLPVDQDMMYALHDFCEERKILQKVPKDLDMKTWRCKKPYLWPYHKCVNFTQLTGDACRDSVDRINCNWKEQKKCSKSLSVLRDLEYHLLGIDCAKRLDLPIPPYMARHIYYMEYEYVYDNDAARSSGCSVRPPFPAIASLLCLGSLHYVIARAMPNILGSVHYVIARAMPNILGSVHYVIARAMPNKG